MARDSGMKKRLQPLGCALLLALPASLATDATALARPKPKIHHAGKSHEASGARQPAKKAAANKRGRVAHASRPKPARSDDKSSERAAAPALTGDLAFVKDAIALARKAKTADATEIQNKIADPAAQRLVEWYILRHPESDAKFNRFAAFIAGNPDWPGMALMRRRAEARLWQERIDATTVRSFTGDQPTSAKGRLALARALFMQGDRDGAALWAREAWRSDELTERSEAEAFEAFRELLTRDDHRARMDKRIGAKDFAGARRAALRLGNDDLAIVKACATVKGDSKKALDLLDSVSADARNDLGYALCRAQALRLRDRIEDAARVVLAAAPETMALQDTNEWWRERRILARKLLDRGQFQTAYEVVRDAALPASDNYRADFHFMAGWIALRYLNDPAAARTHFARIDQGSTNPTVLARANYWRGRVAEATGDNETMRASYQEAARHGTAYYGQLARAKLGIEKIELRPPAPPEAAPAVAEEIVRAADMLYAIGERDVAVSFAVDLAENCTDVATLAALGELTHRRNDARGMLELGKSALARGLPVDHYAFPTIGIPPHAQIAPEIERSMIYSVAKTESAFDQRDKSSANAVGLMQVTPEAGRDTARRFGVSYDWDKMVSDPVYNTQMGAAELSALLKDYNGSHIMTFAGYNAGRGRVRDWVKAYGDPRDPNVDAVDWVERIPFSETRNYVQRVMENLLVYRVRFDTRAGAVAKADQPAVTTPAAGGAPLASAQPAAAR